MVASFGMAGDRCKVLIAVAGDVAGTRKCQGGPSQFGNGVTSTLYDCTSDLLIFGEEQPLCAVPPQHRNLVGNFVEQFRTNFSGIIQPSPSLDVGLDVIGIEITVSHGDLSR
jgi:hypothetical protein